MTRREARFGINVGGLRSRTWRVRSGVKRPELFIEREGLEDIAHVSLHESGKWHMKARGKAVFHWLRPDEIHPGYTRAMVIAQPWPVAMHADAAPDGSIFVPLHKGDERTPQFNIFVERPGANQDTWPGSRSLNTQLITRIPMTDGCTCCVVMQRAPIGPGSQTFGFKDAGDRARLEELLSSPTGMMTLIGVELDGAITLIDGRVEVTP
jgi:hypothetical protein